MSLAVIHMGRRALALDDETYRAMLYRLTGKYSSKDLSVLEKRLVVDEMRAWGFKPKRQVLEGKYAKSFKLYGLQGGILALFVTVQIKPWCVLSKGKRGLIIFAFTR